MTDAAERARALDPTRSFLVQAPAGSGKTELLIQRYLVLLARVESPESVVAITFTRKAAGEMRRRVLQALEEAAGAEPEKPHKAHTWRLARDVRERDRALGWGIAENPSRLRIRTIDSFGDSITRRMPWLSRMGAQPELIDDARELYREAARRTIELITDDRYGPHLERVLLHVDNDFAALEALLAAMLARRDQWLRHLAGVDPAAARPLLERSLRNIVAEGLDAARAAAPALPELAQAETLPEWLELAESLLTKKGTWRKRLGAGLLETLEAHEDFRVALDNVRYLPPAEFDDAQWSALESLIPVLLAAAAELRLVFRDRGQADFSELSLSALHALGEADEPTDLALALDYQIRHLLVDEFQDTSITQFELLAKLTAGWEPGDGRTLFAVGDPMQSIYRFREAEVGLFLKAAREGIGAVRLERLQLTANFRSERGLVEWVNGAFPDVLAPADDMETGAVRFSPSVAVEPATSESPVQVHALLDAGDEAEAARVVEIAAASRGAKTAVLVRARTHLPAILRELRKAGLRYRAVEIDQLGDVAITQDLLALTRALLHPADRVAWLAVLRAPWCGLKLADLHALVGDALKTPVWDLMQSEDRVARLSEDGRMRLLRAREPLRAALDARGERLRAWVEGCWLALGGPACCTYPGEIENAAAFFNLLETLDEGCDTDIDQLAAEVDSLFAAPDPEAGDALEVMSIHKAKGLEFDVVILPGLGRKVRSDEPRLLAWLERTPARGESGLVLAPVKPAGAKQDALYDYVRRVEKEKRENEDARLLYVAATRARRRLHLIGEASVELVKGELSVRPPSGSLLAHLWPAVEGEFVAALAGYELRAESEAETPVVSPAPIRRLSAQWVLPAAPPAAPAVLEETVEAAEPDVPFEWVGDTLRHIGTVVHRMLEQIALDDAADLDARRPVIETALGTLGVPPSEIADAAGTVLRALSATLADERGRWILDPSHAEARSEYAVTGFLDNRLVSIRVDRTFIDSAGVRWIIDFKTSAHEGGGVEQFLDEERERYRKKMSEYARLFALLDPRPIRMGLYFPLLRGWREYEQTATTGGAL